MSTIKKARGTLAPQRRPGMERVAAILKAGADVIAEKGFDDATMAEIASRAGSPIGSLYRFFPNKELLAEALIERYASELHQQFDAIDQDAVTASSDQIADAILDFTATRKGEWKKAMAALLEARSEWSANRLKYRTAAMKRIAKTLRLLEPKLTMRAAQDIAIILFHNMKLMRALKTQENIPTSPGAIIELRQMNRLYLASKLRALKR